MTENKADFIGFALIAALLTTITVATAHLADTTGQVIASALAAGGAMYFALKAVRSAILDSK